MKGLIPYVIAAVAIASVAIAQQPPVPDVIEPAPQIEASDSPKRLTVQVSVADPEDLKVKMGDRLEAGQLIADRSRERQRLEAQQQQLSLTVQKLETSTISLPLPPAAAPAILEPTYLEENAAIERAQATVEQAESAIALKQQKIAYLSELKNLDPLVVRDLVPKFGGIQPNINTKQLVVIQSSITTIR